MGETIFIPRELYEQKIVVTHYMDVRDVALSLEKFLIRNYTGVLTFSKCEIENRRILVDDYDLALMIKSIIKELTFPYSCEVSYVFEDNDFIIWFKTHPDSPPSEYSIKHLTAQAARYRLTSRHEGLSFGIVIPTRKNNSCMVYSKERLMFYTFLYAVFSDPDAGK